MVWSIVRFLNFGIGKVDATIAYWYTHTYDLKCKPAKPMLEQTVAVNDRSAAGHN
jgi:hypothetical protein